ncbi:hypothetical protein Tco_0707353 [Tanacetum coccineum]|uniref:Retrovirus-related Pol polyprotein from transposon TNT 1-94-like beta-barrel domain-containing protein n=1 Tax=Tanacetum coccineum TaxID=301880 RepID=A0ABQ4YBJ7_9ASTR
MVEKPMLNNKGRVTGQREIRPVWNNVQRAPRAAASISTARPVNTVAPKPKVNDALPTTYSYFKAHSPVKRAFNQKSAAKTNKFNEKVNTARVNNVTTARPKAVVSVAVGNGENVVKSSACWIWRPTGNVIDHTSKDSGSYMLKRFDYGNPQYTLQDQGIFDSGCSRHMTGNKSFLTDYQEIDGGFVAFGGSPKGASPSGTLPSNTIPNPKGEMKAITTRSGVAYEGPSNPNKPSPKKVVERETEEITDEEQNDFQGSTAQIPPLVIPKPIPEPEIPKTLPKLTPIPEPEIPKTVPKPNIPYPSRRDNQKNQKIFIPKRKDVSICSKIWRYDIKFLRMLCFNAEIVLPTIRDLLMNKEKLLELVKIPLNENCSAMLLKKLPEKLGDPGKFLIPCEFPGMEICYALADLADFVVVDFEADPRVPLILGRSFLRTSRTLIDVYDGKLILRDGDEQIILHVDGISNQPQKHAKESINMIGDNNGEEKQEHILSNKSPQISSICAITSIFPSIEPKDSFIMGETQPTTYRVEEIVPNPKESKDTFKENDSSFCETSDSLLEEFADELALLAPFPPRNEDFDFKADLRELEMLLNQDPTTNFSPESTIDPNPEKFTVESSLVCLPPPGDDNNIGFDLPLFGSNEDLIPKDDASISKENVQEESFRIYSNPLFEFDNDFNSSDVNPLFNETLEDIENDVSNLYESVLLHTLFSDKDKCFDLGGDINEPQRLKDESDHDTLITFSSENDPLHHKCTRALITLPPRIVKEHKEYLDRMMLLCEISSSLPPNVFHASSSTNIEYLSPYPFNITDSDSYMEEINLFLPTNDLMPPGSEDDDYDSERDVSLLEESLNNDSPSLPEEESPNFDHHDDTSIPRPPPEPPDVEICFNFKHKSSVFITKVVKGIFEIHDFMSNILPTLPTLDSNLNFTFSHDSLGSENKIFDPGIFIKTN